MASPTSANSSLIKASALPCEEISRSSLYAIIPAIVRSRIPVLTSVRRSARSVLANTTRRRAHSWSNRDGKEERETGGYASTVPSSGASTPRPDAFDADLSLSSQELNLRFTSQRQPPSGVDWDVAATGIKLWMAAKTSSDHNGDSPALRSMHIDALRYMHMALPQDLSPLEIQSIRASMSPQLLTHPVQAHALPIQGHPNVLRQSVAQAVCWFVAVCCLIFPYLMMGINRLSQYEREHKLTEKAIANGLDLTSALGERGLDLHHALVRFKDGRVGSACVNTTFWFMESVVGGVTDGLSIAAQSQQRPS